MITLSTDVFTNSYELSKFIKHTADELRKKYDIDRFSFPVISRNFSFDKLFECRNYSIGIYQNEGRVFLEYCDLERIRTIHKIQHGTELNGSARGWLYRSLGRKMKSSRIESASPERLRGSEQRLGNSLEILNNRKHILDLYKLSLRNTENSTNLIGAVKRQQQLISELVDITGKQHERIANLEKIIYTQILPAMYKSDTSSEKDERESLKEEQGR